MKQNKQTIKKFRKSIKGITLIALVVTIIVLLILAAVAINLTIGSNGIFTRAGNAVDKYEEASVNEEKELNSVAEYLDGMTEETIVEAYKAGKIKMGDYVNYQNPERGEYTSAKEKNGVADQKYTVDSSTQWRVLGLSEDGKHLLLTTADPIKRGEVSNPNTENGYTDENVTDMNSDYYLYMYGTEGAYYATDNKQGEGELDKICAIYKNDIAEEARSMKTEDINNLLNLTVKYDNPNAGVYKKEDTSYENNFDNYGILEESYIYEEGDQTPGSALGLEEVEAGHEEKGTAYYYSIGSESNPNAEMGVDSAIYEMLFKGTESYNNKPYYLASYGVYIFPSSSGNSVRFGPGAVTEGNVGCGFRRFTGSNGFEASGRLGVRPVISLKSDVKVSQLEVISGSREQDW